MFLNDHVAMQQTQENTFQVIIHSDCLATACSASYRGKERKKKGGERKRKESLLKLLLTIINFRRATFCLSFTMHYCFLLSHSNERHNP